jgi:MFS family permease
VTEGAGHDPDRLHELADEVLEDLPTVPHTPGRTSAKDLAFGEERPSILEAMGGTMGIIESAVPSAAFVIAITAKAETGLAAIIAVSVALLFAIARILRRETVQFALTGVVGVGISAAIAAFTGDAKNFFIPSFGINIIYGGIALGSVLAGRPFVGYIADGINPPDEGELPWREDPVKLRRYKLASLLWVGIFAFRLIVQVPLYFDDSLVALGTVKVVMGYPLFGIGVWVTWLMVKKAPADAADD